jgi:hypothetical protein
VSSLLKWSFTNPNQKQKNKTKEDHLPYSSFLNLTKGNLSSKNRVENWFLFQNTY